MYCKGFSRSSLAITDERIQRCYLPMVLYTTLVTAEQTQNNHWISRLFNLFAVIVNGVSLCVLVTFNKAFNLPMTKHNVIYLLLAYDISYSLFLNSIVNERLRLNSFYNLIENLKCP